MTLILSIALASIDGATPNAAAAAGLAFAALLMSLATATRRKRG